MTKENKIHFWSIFTTGVVGLFSLWLGISIQDDINTKNAKETQKLARYQMVEAIYPKFEQYIDTCGYVFYDFIAIAESTSDNKTELVGNYYLQEKVPVVEAMINSVNFMSKCRYYFGGEFQESVCKNNVAILLGLHLLERNNIFLTTIMNEYEDKNSVDDVIAAELHKSYYTKNLFSYRKQVEKEMCKKMQNILNVAKDCDNDTSIIVNNIVYDFIFLSYIDNFTVYSNEMSPASEINYQLSKHMLILAICIITALCLCLLVLRYVFDVKIFIKKQSHEI